MNYCKTANNGMQITFLLLLIIVIMPVNIKSELSVVKGFDFEYNVTGKFKPETFYGKNITFLNNKNSSDKSYFSRHTLDIIFDSFYGKQTYNTNIAEFLFSIRSKAVWGNPNSIGKTTEDTSKDLEAVGATHKHFIPLHFFRIREIWLRFDIGQALDLPFSEGHTFTIGAFPFQLGRGIALGDAYAVGPEVLGFYTDSAVDQYAFGAKFSGPLFSEKLHYDLYTAILQNKSSSLSDTGEKILGQEFGRLKTPERGFGKVNFLFAGRLLLEIFNNKTLGLLNVEPYALFNSDPEQKIEFLADSTSKLGTIGFASEYYGDKFECGFDYALNIGQQRVKGWDRNQIKKENRNGNVFISNSHVSIQGSSPVRKVLYFLNNEGKASKEQEIINNTFRDEAQNGKVIGVITVHDTTAPDNVGSLENAANRFRNPYTNKYEGWMFVCDAAYLAYRKDLQIAATVGFASGDTNPNFEQQDGVFSGFISLQELYSGKRVRSAFLFGGAGKLNRPLSNPFKNQNQVPNKFTQNVSGFTNLLFFGTGVKWDPQDWKKKLTVHPNILTFWQEHTIGNTRSYLGTETDIFVDYNILKNMKFYFVASIFFPGTFYADRGGAVLPKDQADTLDELDQTGFEEDRIPGLGNDIAYTFNLGLEYKF